MTGAGQPCSCCHSGSEFRIRHRISIEGDGRSCRGDRIDVVLHEIGRGQEHIGIPELLGGYRQDQRGISPARRCRSPAHRTDKCTSRTLGIAAAVGRIQHTSGEPRSRSTVRTITVGRAFRRPAISWSWPGSVPPEWVQLPSPQNPGRCEPHGTAPGSR